MARLKIWFFTTMMLISGVSTSFADVDADGTSVIGGAFNFIGEVIAFPFRVIGGIFSALF